MYRRQCAVALLFSYWMVFSCASFSRPMLLEQRVAAFEAELRTATIEEKRVPIFLGIYTGATLPSLLPKVVPEEEGGLAYWEWAEISGEGEVETLKRAYGKLRSGGVEFPFAQEWDSSRIYMGRGIHLTFLYKKRTGEWVQRLVVPGILSRSANPETFNLEQTGALRYADKSIQLIDAELIPAAQRAAFIAHTFEMVVVP